MAPKKGSIPWNKGKKNCQKYHTVDITGQRFGRLLAIKLHEIKNSRSYWEFLCDCGNTKIAYLWDVKSNKTKSCGCLNRDMAKIKGERLSESGAMAGKNNPFYKHGLRNTKEYNNMCYAKRRARKLNQTPILTEHEKAKVEMYYKISQYLGENWHVDHIIPLSKGGPHHPDNLQVVTKEYNLQKSNKLRFRKPTTLEYFRV